MPNELHSAQTGLDLHEPMHYLQSTDPGAVGAGKWWLDTTVVTAPILKMRNAADTGWIVVTGNGIEQLFGVQRIAAYIAPILGSGATAAPGATLVFYYHFIFPYIKEYTTAWWV